MRNGRWAVHVSPILKDLTVPAVYPGTEPVQAGQAIQDHPPRACEQQLHGGTGCEHEEGSEDEVGREQGAFIPEGSPEQLVPED